MSSAQDTEAGVTPGTASTSEDARSMARPETVSRERPSRHGKALGEALAVLAIEGRRHAPPLPEMCATCAFRPDCMTNQMAATGMVALNCVLGIDTDRFACHHGMTGGEPAKLCAGYIAAMLAPWDVTKTVVSCLTAELASHTGPDEIRAEFDAWIAKIDPDGTMDDYSRGRAFLRAKSASARGHKAVAAQVTADAPGRPQDSITAIAQREGE